MQLLKETCIAIVGSRNSSEYGEKMTRIITKELVQNNIVIVSGMALGIDSVAHNTCIDCGGKTIAVLGCGFNNIYPKENEYLFKKILANDGLIISEYPINTPVEKKNFPKRNRIISGLSVAILVIEAAYRSGTSITARLAKNQGKKVFCIPNSVGNKNSYGTIDLVMKGAILIRSAKDMLHELGIKYSEIAGDYGVKKNHVVLNDKSKIIVDCITECKGMNAESISLKTGIDIMHVNQILTMLEMDGVIIYSGRNGYDIAEAYFE